MRLVRHASWYLAVLLAGLGLALAAAIPSGETVAPGTDERAVWLAVALAVGAIVVLLAHQRWSKYVGVSALLVLAAFPALLVPYERRGPCWWGPHRPCMDPNIVAWHPGVRLAMFLVLLGAALVTATLGLLRARAQRAASRLP